ncbi:MAG: radical SAM protein [Planctomycetes bacterium]|nr:radical SAM protein [Planctomycetota bacterium]
MERLLIHPPFADPTQPYLSLPTLKGHLRSKGLDARVIDLNLEAAHYLFRKETLEDLAREVGLRFLGLNRAEELTFEEQMEYRLVCEARPKIEDLLAAAPRPLSVFQSSELFYDPAAYSLARRRVEAFFEVLSAAHYPYVFDFNRANHRFVPWGFELFERYFELDRSPLETFYREVFDPPGDWEALERRAIDVDLEEVDFIGISVVFPSQIAEALYLCRFLEPRAPWCFIALGGPCLHQIAIHLEDEDKSRLLEYADAIGLFEGEETLAQLFHRLPALKGTEAFGEDFDVLKEVPNLLLQDPRTGEPVLGPRRTLDLRAAAAPDYSDLDLDRYLAPSRILLYAPTRGCYWDKCSFCYYGLSETATASYREVDPPKAASDLAKLSRRHGVRHFYISCDVLAPAYSTRLAQALIDQGLKIRWSCDLKIEKYFTPERCELLYRSGLRSAAFGVESGSDRMLELMRKGVTRDTLAEVSRSFHRAGVATEWMAFAGHPGEILEEALETVRWIGSEREAVDLFIVGEFGLQPGSHIAQNPEAYGVEKIYQAEGDDLGLYLMFKQKGGDRTPEERRRIDQEVNRAAAAYALSGYPWAGAVSTHHTFLHFRRFGQRIFLRHFQKTGSAVQGSLPPPPPSQIAGLRERPRFSLEAIAREEEKFLEKFYQRALYTTLPARRQGGVELAPLTLRLFHNACHEVPGLRPGRR